MDNATAFNHAYEDGGVFYIYASAVVSYFSLYCRTNWVDNATAFNHAYEDGSVFCIHASAVVSYTSFYCRTNWVDNATAFNHAYEDGGVFCIHASAPPSMVSLLPNNNHTTIKVTAGNRCFLRTLSFGIYYYMHESK